MGDRWLGLKMMAVAMIGILIIGRLVLHISGIVLVMVLLLALLCLFFWGGIRTVLRR